MNNGFSNQSGMDLFGLFVNNFDINVIYEMGWHAAQQWMVLVSAVVMALAIGIRMLEEKAALIGEGKSGYTKAAMNILMIAAGIALYFTLVDLVIRFFNAIYGALDSSTTLMSMTEKLDGILSSIWKADYTFSVTDIIDGPYFVLATGIYAITYCVLVFMVLAMRVAHAVLVSFCVFWGAVALPMSITTGLKILSSFRTLCLLALFWPIVDAFFMYLIGGSFSLMLEKSGLGTGNVDDWSLGTLLFYMGAFSIINIFLAATTFSAPFVAQAIATGSGNVTGMLASFAGAGIAAGATAASYLKRGTNTVGDAAGGAMQNGGGKLAPKLEEFRNNLYGRSGGEPAPIDTNRWFGGDRVKAGAGLGDADRPSSTAENTRTKNPAQQQTSTERSTRGASHTASSAGLASQQQADEDLQMATTEAGQHHVSDAEPSQEDREASREKRQRQGKRGAMIQRNKRLKNGK